MEIDLSAPEPVFEQIVSQIGSSILNGELKPSERLPSIRQLAKDLELNNNTVARAYLIMEESGMITTQGRAGSVVAYNAAENYELWLCQLVTAELKLAWHRLLSLSETDKLARKVWSSALKELRYE